MYVFRTESHFYRKTIFGPRRRRVYDSTDCCWYVGDLGECNQPSASSELGIRAPRVQHSPASLIQVGKTVRFCIT